jgi:uncharacterized protein (TIGR02596 family)
MTLLRTHPLPRAAFTLTELLVVIMVLGMLLVVAAPSLFNSTSASRLTITGDLVLSKLTEAQQEAIASNSEVEVRFIERGEIGKLEDKPRLRALGLFGVGTGDDADSEGDFVPSEAATGFEEGVVISNKPKISSLLDAGFKEEAGPSGNRERYLSFRFLPDGSTNLAAGSPWFLTLVSTEGEEKEGVPPNFYTVQIDAATGRIRSFRP